MMARNSKPHVAESIRDEHGYLKEQLPQVRQALTARRMGRQQMADLMDEVVQHVLDHFEHEEHGGYFTGAVQAAPWLSERVKALLREHNEMVLQLVVLQQLAADGLVSSHWWRRLEKGFAEFVERFAKHEAAENELLQEAYCDDIGAGD